MTDLWHNDLIQFARLLDEIRATGTIDYDGLCVSMDLEQDDIDVLFERATRVFERSKAELQFRQDGIFHEAIPADHPVQPLTILDIDSAITPSDLQPLSSHLG